MSNGSSRPSGGTVASLVKWYADRGASTVSIVDRVAEKFGMGSGRMSQLVANQLSSALGRYSQPSDIAHVISYVDPNLGRSSKGKAYERVGVTIDYYSPNDPLSKDERTMLDRGYTVDIPVGLRGVKRRQALLNQVAAQIARAYPNQIKTTADARDFILSFVEEED